MKNIRNTVMKERIQQLDEELSWYKNQNIHLINEKVKFEHLLLASMVGNIVLALIAFT